MRYLPNSFLLLFLFLFLTTACLGVNGQPLSPLATKETPSNAPLVTGTDGFPWWNDTAFYEVFVRSFQDSDGDGVGDLNGLIDKLDYLNDGDPNTTSDLGITGIWLMPIMESPSYHGYDVVDYVAVDQEYGSLDDFRRLMEEAHARGIRVVIDLVLNHTSTEHPWFQASQDADAPTRDWYIWATQRESYRGPWGQPVWHRGLEGYYYGVFWEGMPDLNLENPVVTEALFDVTRFWLDEIGVDGFRLDAIKHLVERGRIQENTPETHRWLADFFRFTKELNPQAFTVGEAWTSTEQVLDYTGDEVDIAFQFDLAQKMIAASEFGIASLVQKEQAAIVQSYPPGQYATFLTNHDQNRLMSDLKEDTGAARVAAAILLTSPGVPFIYYGEEIGMTGTKPDELLRRPMQWTGDDARVGFSGGQPWQAPAADFAQRNVADEVGDPDSLWHLYRVLIHLRNQHPALRIGQWIPVEADNRKLYAFLRQSEHETLLVLINLDDRPIEGVQLTLAEGLLGVGESITLLGEGEAVAPMVTPAGGFDAYTPFEWLAPQSVSVVQLR